MTDHGSRIWDDVVDAIAACHRGVASGEMFGMPCLKRPDGKVVAVLWKDGGIALKLVDEGARSEALALSGTEIATHAFDPGRKMHNWVHIPATAADEWERLIEGALESWR